MEVLQVQEVMTNEEMTGTMVDYDLNTYPPAKYPTTCKKSGKRKHEKAMEKERANKKSKRTAKKNEGEAQDKITEWRPWKYVNPKNIEKEEDKTSDSGKCGWKRFTVLPEKNYADDRNI
ncbi:unnamed protein product [Pocillopora meandrina]|uniref:Uncharacterized protein n=1 Tax=Pocillopora meandrina TaxID=46732 RepID=A0AAU9VR27_9CNID|nr:unnamed protein product [Pocillopora meandrina]